MTDKSILASTSSATTMDVGGYSLVETLKVSLKKDFLQQDVIQ